MQEWGLAAQAGAAELVVSELVSNALLHGMLAAAPMPGELPIVLTLLRRERHLLCLVADPGTRRPVLMNAGAGAEDGRGLQVVASCSLQWGWEPANGPGKVVWALLG